MEENKTVAEVEETLPVAEETKKQPLNASIDPDKFDRNQETAAECVYRS
ncbi:MAG: hypothetical protein MSA53_03040 [Bacteroidales bacterium]|nr:hypothetical protein [Bacteroidales bacterium]